MAIFNNRKPLPKTIKIKAPTLLAKYRLQNKYCELCAHKGKLEAYRLEIHHLIPGAGRTDEIWNIIRLCGPCHDSATLHKHGVKAKHVNYQFFAIKYLKDEISEEKLLILNLEIEVWDAINRIEESKNEIINFG